MSYTTPKFQIGDLVEIAQSGNEAEIISIAHENGGWVYRCFVDTGDVAEFTETELQNIASKILTFENN